MQNHSVSNPLFDKTLQFSLARIYEKTWTMVLIFGIVGFAVPALYGYIFGLPVPTAQDELSNTVAADTYAHGRLTNPTPANFEHFETPHVLMEPSYISKYPPLQGIFMAAGQILFGYQIFGIWLSCGLFAASLFWMLSVWTKRDWAVIGTVSMILLLGINSYWAQSFWGGMIAASGGALFFAGFRQIFKSLSVSSTGLMVLGGIILVNSRPFEGTVTMLPALFVLLIWLFRSETYSFSKKFTQLILPGFIIAGLALSAMCYQYYRVTGNPFTMPYSVHHAQYYPTPLFSFQQSNPNATKGNARIRRVFDNYTQPSILQFFFNLGLPDSKVLRSVYGFIYLNFAFPFFLFTPVLLLLFYISIPLVIKSDRWFLFIAANIVFTFACISIGVWWDQFHYVAPLTCCFFLLLTQAFRLFYESGKGDLQKRKLLITFLFLIVGSTIYQQLYSDKPLKMETDFSTERAMIIDGLSNNTKIKIKIPTRATFFKDEFEKIVEKSSDPYIAIVSYDPNFSFHDEIVYNKADIENAKLIWAHDLGDEKNKSLLEHYNNRKVLLIKVNSEIEIEPIDIK